MLVFEHVKKHLFGKQTTKDQALRKFYRPFFRQFISDCWFLGIFLLNYPFFGILLPVFIHRFRLLPETF